jgi:transposase-like protein/predicted nucleic acid-binding Zn finger protein
MEEQNRQTKGLQIFSQANSIRKISKYNYRVISQSQDKFYNITKLRDSDVWICDCADFNFRLTHKDDKRCKHIRSVLLLQDSIEKELNIEKLDVPKICQKCNSTKIVKNGIRIVQNNLKRQRYACKQCDYKFSFHESGFSGMRISPQIITESINLKMSGMSYRNIKRHIKAAHDVTVSHVSVTKWVKKYMAIIKEYVDSFVPELSDVWSLDEAMINVKDTEEMKAKGLYDWLWTIIDPKTKFVIATEVSKRREIQDARNIIAKGKQLSKPSYVITDSLRTYEEAIRKELDNRKVAHIKTKAIKDGFQNRPIERYHNELREKTKTMRGLGNDESAQRFADAYASYHNFAREHEGLDGITPAEAAKIDLGLGHDKIKDLITKSKESTKCNFVVQLGKRIELVNIVNEKDCIKVIAKGWIEKQTWREVNDILKLSGFSWLSNGKDSYWLKPIS